MKIKREVNGQEMEFELTTSEMINASCEIDDMHYKEDVEMICENEEIELTTEQLERAVELYRKFQSNDDGWSYNAIEAIIIAKKQA